MILWLIAAFLLLPFFCYAVVVGVIYGIKLTVWYCELCYHIVNKIIKPTNHD